MDFTKWSPLISLSRNSLYVAEHIKSHRMMNVTPVVL